MIDCRERIRAVVNQWFLMEPALFTIYLTHELTSNSRMNCPVRSGAGRIEYNATMLNMMSDPQLAELLKIEMLRLCFRHPYERQPTGCHPLALHMGSDMVIAPHYKIVYNSLVRPQDYNLPLGQYFEWYATRMHNWIMDHPGSSLDVLLSMKGNDQEKQDEESSDSSDEKADGEREETPDHSDGKERSESPSIEREGNGEKDDSDNSNSDASGRSEDEDTLESLDGVGGEDEESEEASGETVRLFTDDYTGLWREDEEYLEKMKDTISGVTRWGSVPSGVVDEILKALVGRIDYRKVLSAFHTSVISTNRSLTRMKPNRRFGYDQMGSKHELSAKLLVAVDVSGSVSDEALGKFFRIISRFFKYGIETVDVIQFDTVVGEVMSLKEGSKAVKSKRVAIRGRGGTNFQCVIDYLQEHNTYDGLVFFTDGYADRPFVNFPTRAKILWVTETEDQYNYHKDWMKKLGRACFIV